jgi:hypothetical protein
MPAPRRAPTKRRLPSGRLGTRLLKPPAAPTGRQPPTLVAYSESSWDVGTAKTTATSFTWEAFDRFVAVGLTRDNVTTLTTPADSSASGTLTFTQVTTPTNAAGTCKGYSWVATATGNGSATITSTAAFTAAGIAVWQFRGSEGVGTSSADTTAAKTASLARSQDESAVVTAIADFAAGAPTGYAWTPTPSNDRRATQFGTNYAVYVADWVDQDAAGTTSYGISGTASAGNHTNVVLEVLGAAGGGGGPTQISVSDSGQLTGAETLDLQATLTAADATQVTGSENVAVGSPVSVADSGQVTGSENVAAAASVSVADSAQVTGAETVTPQATLAVTDTTQVTGTDAASLAATLAAADSGQLTGSDQVALQATLSVADTSQVTGADQVSVDQGVTAKSVTDSGQLARADTPAVATTAAVADGGELASSETAGVLGPPGTPDAILAATNWTGVLQEVWDDPEAPASDYLDATDRSAATAVRFSFPTPSLAPGSGGPTRFQVWVRRTDPGIWPSEWPSVWPATPAANPTVVVDLWESGSFVRQLVSVAVTSASGQLVTGDLNPAELSDPSGAGVELRIRGVPS